MVDYKGFEHKALQYANKLECLSILRDGAIKLANDNLNKANDHRDYVKAVEQLEIAKCIGVKL